MVAESPSYKQYIADIFDSNRPLVSSKLVYLSDIGKEEMEFLRSTLAKANVERRHQFITQLVHLSDSDLKLDFSNIFVSCLYDSDEAVRIQAVAGLEAEENYLVIAPLVRVLKEDTSAEVRAAAGEALGKFALSGELGKLSTDCTDKIYMALVEVLDDETEPVEVKRRALEAIAPMSLPRVKEFIEEAYHSTDAKLKASAIYAMGRNCDPEWLEILLAELSSREAEMRYEAANACGELGAEEAVSHLGRLVGDKDAQVQEAAIKALGEVGGEEARQILNKLKRSTQPRIHQAAMAALEELCLCEDTLSSEH